MKKNIRTVVLVISLLLNGVLGGYVWVVYSQAASQAELAKANEEKALKKAQFLENTK